MLDSILSKFENATNALVNKDKTKMLALGKWRNRTTWPCPYLIPLHTIKLLGITWCDTFRNTLLANRTILGRKADKCLLAAQNRTLTVHQKVPYFNQFVVPVLTFYGSIFQITKSDARSLQLESFHFIWAEHLEKLSLKEMQSGTLEGGLGLVNVYARCRACYLNKLLKQATRQDQGSVHEIYEYWLGLNILRFKAIKPNTAHKLSPPKIFKKAIRQLNNLYDSHVITQTTFNAKIIYKSLIKAEISKPKIMVENLHVDFNLILLNINNPFLSPQAREVLFMMVHNILPVKDNLFQLKLSNDPFCKFCPQNQIENIPHLLLCQYVQPAF